MLQIVQTKVLLESCIVTREKPERITLESGKKRKNECLGQDNLLETSELLAGQNASAANSD